MGVNIPTPKIWAFYRDPQTQNGDFLQNSFKYLDYISSIILNEFYIGGTFSEITVLILTV
jgi:hypothetical protein